MATQVVHLFARHPVDSGCYRDLCRGVLDIVARVRDTVCSHESAIFEDGSILTLARRSKKYGGYD